jgi:DNA replication and repair protein RecF
VGPHRADWRIHHSALPNGETLSRGQAKLTALTCVLAQAEHYVGQRGEWPVVLLDDLASELDRAHQQRVLQRLAAGQAQVFVTGTELPRATGLAHDVFHVEQGRVAAVDRSSATRNRGGQTPELL